jgi:hypothetical protein
VVVVVVVVVVGVSEQVGCGQLATNSEFPKFE